MSKNRTTIYIDGFPAIFLNQNIKISGKLSEKILQTCSREV